MISIQNLNYQNILKNINLDIPENSFISISGNNKCGKTTLIKLLSGLLDDQESIILDKVYLNSLPKVELYKQVSFVIPSLSLPFIFNSVEKELLFVLDNLGLDSNTKKNRYKKMISLFNLKNDTQKDPHQLFLFLKIKVLLALAVIHKPRVLLLDDITLMLEKDEKEEIFRILRQLRKEGITIIMATSNLEDSLEADKLVILNNGTIILEGKPLEVLQEDSLLNKIGLRLPFMVDLSLKLKYYDLIDEIELDMDRMVNLLWK